MQSFLFALALFGSSTPAEAAGLEVASTGSGTKSVLRLAPSQGAAQDLKVSRTMRVVMSMMGQEMTLDAPRFDSTLTASATTVTPEGYDVAVAYGDVKMGPAAGPAGMLGAGMQGLSGQSGTLHVTARGEVTSRTGVAKGAVCPGQEEGAAGLDLAMFMATLPAEAVGPGARWTVTDTLNCDGGIRIVERRDITLVSVTGSSVKLAFDLTQSTTPGSFSSGGTTVTLTKSELTGKGEVTLDLKRAFPTAATWTGDLDLDMAMGGMATRQRTHFEFVLGAR